MGLTVTPIKRVPRVTLGALTGVLCNIDFDSSLDAGGESLANAAAGIRAADLIGFTELGGDGDAAAYLFKYNNVSKKLIPYATGAGAMQVYSPGGGDIKGSANTDVGIASGTLPTNGALLSTLAAANNTTAFTIAAQPDVPRNVSISCKNTNAGASTGNAVDFVIVGTFRGAAQTETISFTALQLTSTAQNEVATKYGSKPFDSITSITPSAAQPANWQHAAGVGSKIGLLVDLLTPATADVIKLTKNAANLSTSGIVDATNMTVNFGTLSDGDDVAVIYRTAAQPVAAGTDMSAVKLRGIVWLIAYGVG